MLLPAIRSGLGQCVWNPFSRFYCQGKNYTEPDGKSRTLPQARLNTQLSFIQVVEIYQTRWTIEVFFKESKQLLGLGKCQSNDFDAQIADSTITMIQHMLLTLRYRVDNYESMNGLFSQISESAIQQRLNQRIWGLFVELLQIIATVFDQVDEQELLERIFQNDRANELIARLPDDTEQNNKAA